MSAAGNCKQRDRSWLLWGALSTSIGAYTAYLAMVREKAQVELEFLKDTAAGGDETTVDHFFEQADTNGDGELSTEELEAAYKAFLTSNNRAFDGPTLTVAIGAMMKLFDVDHDGAISAKELKLANAVALKAIKERKAQLQYTAFASGGLTLVCGGGFAMRWNCPNWVIEGLFEILFSC